MTKPTTAIADVDKLKSRFTELLHRANNKGIMETGNIRDLIKQSDILIDQILATITEEARMDGARVAMRTVTKRFKNAGLVDITPDEMEAYIETTLTNTNKEG